MDTATAKAEIAHGKQDLRDARQQDLWQQMIQVGRQQQTQGEQPKQTETAGRTLSAAP